MTPVFGFRRLTSSIFTMLASIILSVLSLQSQPVSTNRGRDFQFSFLPNYHMFALDSNEASRLRDSLYVYVACDVPTQGTITATNRFGAKRQIPFQIADPSQIYTFAIAWQSYELDGWNYHGIPANDAINQCQRIAQQSFRVVADDDITVYALNQADRTSDAFLVLPTSALGLEYRVMSYQSDGFMSTSGPLEVSPTSTPSEFAVTAILDSTKVLIFPTVETFRFGSKTDTVLLMKGETYLVQARITRSNLRGDLTGSRVVADKPVAVFGGHQRALLPVELRGRLSSRDCIIEQMPPLSAWGKSAFLASYPQPNGISQFGSDIYRVLAAFDSTEIFLGGVKIRTLKAGQYYTDNLNAPGYLTGSKPILVAQYKKTSSDINNGTNNGIISDPLMMIIPPKEQFLLSYRFINAQSTQINRNAAPSPMFTAQYVMVVVPQTAVSTVRLDGNLVGAGSFQPIPGSTYLLATLRVGDGTHTIAAAEPIGIYVFGYGLVNSYGYVGGMSFIEFDYQQPEISAVDSCFSIRGIAVDTHRTDSRLARVESLPDSLKNMVITIEKFKLYSDSVHFSGSLIDIYQDGEFSLIAEDSAGLSKEEKFKIPGFTLSASDSINGQGNIRIVTDGPLKHQYCFPIRIYNYGAFPQIVTSALFRDTTRFSILTKLPLIIEPRTSIQVKVCFYETQTGIYDDTLFIGSSCAQREILMISVRAIPDSIPPRITRASSPCPTPINLVIAESLPSDLGIKSLDFIDSLTINCIIAQSVDTGYQSTGMNITPIDPDEDAYFTLRAIDTAGNTSFYHDTIPGFTLRFVRPVNDIVTGINYGETVIGEINCLTVSVENYGKFAMNFGLPFLVKNTRFSMPQSQNFPIILPPNQKQNLEICFAPVAAGLNLSDTLLFTFGCRTRPLELLGISKEIIRDGPSRCDVPIRSVSTLMPASYGRSFLDQNQPNPITQNGRIQFGFSLTTQATLTLYDALGTKRALLADGEFPSGIYEVLINADNLPNGVYFYELITPTSNITKLLSIVR